MAAKVNEEQEKILKLWKEGLSGSEIAKEIGTTRNAIMGKLYRLRENKVITYKSMATRLKAVKQRELAQKRAMEDFKPKLIIPPKIAIKQPKEAEPKEPEIVEEVEVLLPKIVKYLEPKKEQRKPCTFMDLQPLSCRYVVSGTLTKEFMFCNQVKKVGSSYCEEHHARCNILEAPKRKKAQENDVTA